MGKIFFSAFVFGVVSANVCFGQGIPKSEVRVSLISYQSMYTKPLLTQNNYAMQRLMSHTTNAPDLSKYFYANALIMQVEGESGQPKTPFWKQAGIYGLELFGGECGVAVSWSITLIMFIRPAFGTPTNIKAGYAPFVISNTLITSTCVWVPGKLTKQRGSWWKASIGAGIGAFWGYLLEFIDPEHKHTKLLALRGALFLGAPALGGVIGFNL